MEGHEKITIDLSGLEGNELTIRHGEALQQREPNRVFVKGHIDNPEKYFHTRKHISGYFHLSSTHVLVCKSQKSVRLVVNEKSFYSDEIIGLLNVSREMEAFGINTGKTYSPKDFANLLRKNIYCLKNKATANSLILALNKLHARINTEAKDEKDNKGNTNMAKTTKVETNLPEERIEFFIPIFEGEAPVSVSAEIYIEPYGTSEIRISLESDQLYETLDQMVTEILDRATKVFVDSGVTVLYV